MCRRRRGRGPHCSGATHPATTKVNPLLPENPSARDALMNKSAVGLRRGLVSLCRSYQERIQLPQSRSNWFQSKIRLRMSAIAV